MKKLILSIALTAFAAIAAQADDAGAKATEQHSCCAKTKVSQKASASCCQAKQASVKKTVVKQALLSPKATAAL